MKNPFNLMSGNSAEAYELDRCYFSIELPYFETGRIVDDIDEVVYERYNPVENGNYPIVSQSYDAYLAHMNGYFSLKAEGKR